MGEELRKVALATQDATYEAGWEATRANVGRESWWYGANATWDIVGGAAGYATWKALDEVCDG